MLKKIFIVGALLVSTTAFAEFGKLLVQPELTVSVPNHIFAPQGFDDNDNAQVIIDGELPSTCYKVGPVNTRIDHEAKKVFIQQQLYFYPGAWCANVSIPYANTVDLGPLKAGKYEVFAEDSAAAQPKPFTELPIAVSTSQNPDDFLYAPLNSAHVVKLANTGLELSKGVNTLVLNGIFRNSCMHFKELRVNRRDNNVIEVLPIVTIDQGVSCTQVTEDFQLTMSLKDMPAGRYLVHVRSLNGQSLNQVVDL